MNTYERLIPMRKPPGHKPAIQRYSVRFPGSTTELACVYLGAQAKSREEIFGSDFLRWANAVLGGEQSPDASDFAEYVDAAGFVNVFAVAYWLDPRRFERWRAHPAVSTWWDRPERNQESLGYWMECLLVPLERMESISFLEYLGGIARCPQTALVAIEESGYFGAMRDRIPITAVDSLCTPLSDDAAIPEERDTSGSRWLVEAPLNLVSIRSGVSWEKCGEEQLSGYHAHLRPALNRGMEHLRTHGAEAGCLCLRQVQIVTADGTLRPEGYSHGYFLSLKHLEQWSHYHPTHLAIYKQAMADRKKYQEKLELRTYHEVFALPGPSSRFEYVGCHSATGLLPYFAGRRIG